MFNQNNEVKTNFLLGLTSGVAVISLLGFILMSVAYFQKGSVPSDKENTAAKTEEINKDVPTDSPTQAQPTNVKVDIGLKDWTRGSKEAPVTIVTFSDIQCPYCKKFHDTMRQVMTAYKDDVRWVFKHFPLDSIHPYARKAAEATECAGEQGKFWEYTDKLFANQSSLSNDYFSQAAKELKLSQSKFDSCLSSGKYASKVTADFEQGRKIGVNGTPASVVNGEFITGALPFDNIKSIIDNKLNK